MLALTLCTSYTISSIMLLKSQVISEQIDLLDKSWHSKSKLGDRHVTFTSILISWWNDMNISSTGLQEEKPDLVTFTCLFFFSAFSDSTSSATLTKTILKRFHEVLSVYLSF